MGRLAGGLGIGDTGPASPLKSDVSSRLTTSPTAPHYVSLAATVGVNVLNPLVVGPAVFAEFAVLTAAPLLGVGLLSRGLDVVFAANRVERRSFLRSKVAAAVVTAVCVGIVALVEGLSATAALASCGFGLGVVIASVADAELVRHREWRPLLSYRLTYAACLLAGGPLTLAVTDDAVAAVASSGAAVATLGTAWFAAQRTFSPARHGVEPDTPLLPSHRLISVLWHSIGQQAPGNFLSNGMLLCAAATIDDLTDVARVRLLILIAGIVLALAPLGTAQVAALAAEHPRDPAVDRRVGHAIRASLVAAVGLAVAGPLVIGRAYADYDLSTADIVSVLLVAPLMAASALAIALRVAEDDRGSRDAAQVGFFGTAAALCAALIGFEVAGSGAVPTSLLILAAVPLAGTSRTITGFRPDIVIAAGCAAIGAMMTTWPR